MRIFISYSTKDQDFVNRVASYLRARGHNVWIDRLLLTGDNWWDVIVNEIRNCDILLTFLTQRSLDSIYCKAERDYAFSLGKPFLTYLLQKIDLPSEQNMDEIQATFLPDFDDASKFTVIELGIERLSAVPKVSLPDPEPYKPTTPKFNPNDIVQVQIAMEDGVAALNAQNLSLAQIFFKRIAQTSHPEYGRLAIEQLNKIQCRIQYNEILSLINTPDIDDAVVRTRIVDYKERGYAFYDPRDILSRPEFVTFRGTEKQWEFVKVLIDEASTLPQRLNAAKTLGTLGDPRPGVGIKESLPEIVWRELEGFSTSEGHRVYLSKFPVTNVQFAVFDTSFSIQSHWWGDDPVVRGSRNARAVKNRYNYPVTHVTWYEARAFCRWLGAQTGQKIDLPTEREWLWGARGDKYSQKYPYGVDYISGHANMKPSLKKLANEPVINELFPVGVLPTEANSIHHIVDMLGNVWEWCRWLTDRDRQPCRGGGWHNSSVTTDLNTQNPQKPETFYDDLGFRVALYVQNGTITHG